MLAIDDKNDYFGFVSNSGGLFNFDGVMSNGKAIDNISVNKNNNTVTVAYKDENQYLVSAQISELNNIVTINNISEKWNNQDTKNDIAMESLIAMLLSGRNNVNTHPDELKYTDTDPDYTIPESIVPETGETFDTITEKWYGETAAQDVEVVWGVGVINKGQSTEIVNRLIYPDNSQISLINFNGEGGIG